MVSHVCNPAPSEQERVRLKDLRKFCNLAVTTGSPEWVKRQRLCDSRDARASNNPMSLSPSENRVCCNCLLHLTADNPLLLCAF